MQVQAKAAKKTSNEDPDLKVYNGKEYFTKV
jgi:hypothetical protein